MHILLALFAILVAFLAQGTLLLGIIAIVNAVVALWANVAVRSFNKKNHTLEKLPVLSSLAVILTLIVSIVLLVLLSLLALPQVF
jgi:uncharacterized membrane protein YidH (DUF202 family)